MIFHKIHFYLNHKSHFSCILFLFIFSIQLNAEKTTQSNHEQVVEEDLPNQENIFKNSLDSDNLENQVYWESYSQSSIQPSASEKSKPSDVEIILDKEGHYTYSSYQLPNPFLPPMIEDHIAKVEIDVVSILQQFDVDSLNLVGTWKLDNGTSYALIVTPSQGKNGKKEAVTVKVGDPAGINGGHIFEIKKDEVIIREFSLAPDGTRQFVDKNILLNPNKNEHKNEHKITIQAEKISDVGNGLPNQKDYVDRVLEEQSSKNKN